MSFICRLFKKRKAPEPTGLVEVNAVGAFSWSEHEMKMVVKVNELRMMKGLKPLKDDIKLKKLSRQRVEFWKVNNYTKKDNLHNYFLGIKQQQIDSGAFKDLGENANLGITADFEAFKKSPSHLANMLGDWTYIGITDRYGYCCMLFGK